MAHYSPLRYPGGKSKLSKFIGNLIVENDLVGCTYVEPYAGGAGIAFYLLQNNIVEHAVINDINRSVFSFWYSILNNTDEFCDMIENVPLAVVEWERQKEIQANPNEHSLLQLGFSTFFLNRTNRSGIIKSGGVIGGKDQSGKWKIDARFNRKELIGRIKAIELMKDRITIQRQDAIDFIRNSYTLPENTFVYLDPPYYKKGRELYENHYKPEDHREVYEAVSENLHHKWIITYDNVPEISNLYQNFRQQVYTLNYSAATRYNGTEIMIFGNEVNIEHGPLHPIKRSRPK